MPNVSPSVLIIRLDAIGDALALAPLLAAFGQRGIPVDVVLRSLNAHIFSRRALREVIVAEFELRSHARANLVAIDRLGDVLRHRGYSHVLVATEDPSGYRLARATGAEVRIGFADYRGKPLKALWSRRLLSETVYRSAGLDPRAPHECEVLFRLGTPLLGEERPTRDATQLRPLVLDREPVPDQRIAMQITDKWERLGIEVPAVAALARRLGALGAVRFFSARTEAAYAQRIAESAAVEIAYFDAVEPWKEAIGAARAIVTPDSGALHVAGMTGTPVVAIFPPGPGYELNVARWSPWAAPHRVVKADSDWPVRAADALAQLLSA